MCWVMLQLHGAHEQVTSELSLGKMQLVELQAQRLEWLQVQLTLQLFAK